MIETKTEKYLIIIALSMIIFLSGCEKKAPNLDERNIGKHNISDTTQIVGDTVTIDESKYGNPNNTVVGTGKSLDSMSQYNSSSNGFKSIYFEFGDYGISSEMENRISSNANIGNGAKIKIEGNCDEFGTDEYNCAPSPNSPKDVKDSMMMLGVRRSNMIIVSFGESNPVCSSITEECYAQNRRVDLRLVK